MHFIRELREATDINAHTMQIHWHVCTPCGTFVCRSPVTPPGVPWVLLKFDNFQLGLEARFLSVSLNLSFAFTWELLEGEECCLSQKYPALTRPLHPHPPYCLPHPFFFLIFLLFEIAFCHTIYSDYVFFSSSIQIHTLSISLRKQIGI